MNQNEPGLRDYLAVLRRRRVLMLSVFLSLVALTVATAFGLQEQYGSTATIAIIRPEIPENLARTTVATYDTDQQILRINDRVMSYDNIKGWIEKHNLYPEIVALEKAGVEEASSVVEFRGDTAMATFTEDDDPTSRRPGETIGFTVSFYYPNPTQAWEVAKELASAFLDENRRQRQELVGETVAFFEQEAERLQQNIVEAEAELADFKERNAGMLPEVSGINVQMMDRTERELDQADREIRALEERVSLLRAELAQQSPSAALISDSGETLLGADERLKVLQREYSQLISKYAQDHPDVVRVRREIALLSGGQPQSMGTAQLEQELSRLQAERDGMLQKYSPDHPDVIRLNRRIDNLQSSIDSGAMIPPPASPSTVPDNPLYIQLSLQVQAAENDLSAMRARRNDLRARLRDYEDRLILSPKVEKEYLALNRDYDISVREYNEIRQKQADAQRARELELNEKSERYELQYAPKLPRRPAFPNKIAILILGFVFAIGCSLGGGILAEMVDPTVRGSRDIRSLMDMPPLAVVPRLENERDKSQRRRRWGLAGAAGAAVCVAIIYLQTA